MMNNLINFVAKLYASMLVLVILIGTVIGGGDLEADVIGIAALIGMVMGFGAIMIGNVVMEAKEFLEKHKVVKEQKVEEVAQ